MDFPPFENVLDAADLANLSVYLGRNIRKVSELVSAVRAVTTLSVNGTEITLDPYLLNRLKSRCHPTEDFGEFIKRTVKEQLAGYCGA